MKKLKIISFVVIVALLFLVMLFVLGGKYKLNQEEAFAYTSLRLAEAKSALDGTGALTREHLEVLKQIAVKNNGTWFADGFRTFYVNIIDTSDEEITTISDKDYTATFIVIGKSPYVLKEYKFEKRYENGYRIKIVEKYDDDYYKID